MTPDEVDAVVFGKGSLLHRGYDELAVDEALDRVEAALRTGEDPKQLAAEVHHVRFAKAPLGRVGYAVHHVDGFFDRLLHELGDDTSR